MSIRARATTRPVLVDERDIVMRLGPIDPAGDPHTDPSLVVGRPFRSSSRRCGDLMDSARRRGISQADHEPRADWQGHRLRSDSRHVRDITCSDHLPAAHRPDCARIGDISVTPRRLPLACRNRSDSPMRCAGRSARRARPAHGQIGATPNRSRCSSMNVTDQRRSGSSSRRAYSG